MMAHMVFLLAIFLATACTPLKENDKGAVSNLRVKDGGGKQALAAEGVLDLIEGEETTTSGIPAAFSDMVGSVVKKVIEPIAGAGLAEAFVDLFKFASHGFGAGMTMSVAGGVAGHGASGNINLEMLYHRPSGAGEIAVFCAPGLGVTEGTGAAAAAGYYFVKTLGCNASADHEGGVLRMPFSLGSYNVSVGLGMDPAHVATFLRYVNDGRASVGLTPEALNLEMERFEAVYIDQLKRSQSPLEIVVLTTYLVFINRTLEASLLAFARSAADTDVDGLSQEAQSHWRSRIGILQKMPVIIDRLAATSLSLEVFKKRNYPSLKSIYARLLEKLVPVEDYVFSRAILSELVNGMRGCDSISFGQTGSGKAKSLGDITSSLSYAYTVNPEHLAIDAYQREKKLLLDIDSFADFLDPEKYAVLAETLAKKVDNATLKPAVEAVSTAAEDGKNAVEKGAQEGLDSGSKAVDAGLDSVGGLFLGVGEDIASFTGADTFGPINFLMRLTNLADPRYIANHCIDPTRANSEQVVEALKAFVLPPLPDSREGLHIPTPD